MFFLSHFICLFVPDILSMVCKWWYKTIYSKTAIIKEGRWPPVTIVYYTFVYSHVVEASLLPLHTFFLFAVPWKEKKKREIIFHNIHQSKCDSFSCHLYLFDFVCLFVLVLSVLMRSVVAELSFHVWKFKLFWDSSPKKTTCIFITWNWTNIRQCLSKMKLRKKIAYIV